MKKILTGIVLAWALGSVTAQAGAYTSWGVPTMVEVVNGGVLIAGPFGDPNNCGQGNYVFMSQSSSTYKDIVAMAYTALAAGKELMFYANSCGQVGFHWTGNTINFVSDGHTAAIR
jgi:hypothetical protein